jgi:plasmid rolling circle replication initiator protein Rep
VKISEGFIEKNHYSWERHLEKALGCNLCNEIALDPKRCGSCEEIFCNSCIQNKFCKDFKCPLCNKRSPTLKTLPKELQQVVEVLSLECRDCGM